jgi:hypothetical protein
MHPSNGPNPVSSAVADFDKRRAKRVTVQVSVVIDGTERLFIPCRSRDLSLVGVFLNTREVLPIDTVCDLTFYLGPTGTEYSVYSRARVARIEDGGMALEFLNLSDRARASLETMIKPILS